MVGCIEDSEKNLKSKVTLKTVARKYQIGNIIAVFL